MTDVSQRAVLSRQGIRDSLAPVSDRMPRIVTVTLVSLLIPVYFAPGGLLLSPARIVLLVLVPMLMTRLLRGVYGPITAIDWLVFVNLALSVLSIFVNNPEQAVTFAGSNAKEVAGGYGFLGAVDLMSVAIIRLEEALDAASHVVGGEIDGDAAGRGDAA